MRGLLVCSEDDALIAIVRRAIWYQNFDVLLCSDPNEIQSVCQRSTPALAIIDADINTHSLQQIRKVVGDIPIIAVLDSPQGADLFEADWSTGVDDILFKPICADVVRVRISVALRNLAERQALEHSLKMSRQHDEMRVFRIAHNLNNKIALISACNELLEKSQKLPDETGHVSKMVVKATQQARGLIRQMLATGARHSEPLSELDASLVVSDSLAELRKILPDQIRVVTRMDPDCVIQGNAHEIEELLLNLVVNARDAMPDGGTVTLGLERLTFTDNSAAKMGDTPSGEFICLTVSDTGCGISHRLLQRIGEPFLSTKGPGHGSGLGLFIAHDIVKRHGAFWRIVSEPGRGATFLIYFPAIHRCSQPAAIGDTAPGQEMCEIEAFD